MKKLLVILGVLIALILLVAVLIPVIFKDDIKKAIDDVITENINANVYYDPESFSLTLFSNFPNFTLSIDNFGISGKNEFVSDTLVSIGSFEIEIDLMSVLSGGKITINSITLNQPKIKVLVLANGKTNYDIDIIPEDEPVIVEESGETTAFNIEIKKWEIINGNIVYIDQIMNFYTSVLGINHVGYGDFTQTLFDLTTTTIVDDFSLGFGSTEYMSNKTVNIDLIMSMDLDNMKFIFKENTISINDFGFGFDGYVSMPGDDIDMDIIYGGKNISMKSILSLIPGDYQTYLESITAGGVIDFNGFVHGKYNETLLPTINAKFEINDGSVSYATYPIPMEKINVNAEMNIPGENMNDISFNMDNFSMLMDGESVSAKLFFKNLANYTWNFSMNGNLDLEKIMKIIPMEGMNLKGKVITDFTTSGNMALVQAEQYEKIPVSGSMTINDFYFSNADLPQGFGISSSKMIFNSKSISLDNFDAILGKSDIHLDGKISNYIGFALDSTKVLQGNLNFSSNEFDINEWVAEEKITKEPNDNNPTNSESDTITLKVVHIPENIHFIMKANIKKITYGNMPMTDLVGNILIKDGTVRMENTGFDMLGSAFTIAGSYITANVENPVFDSHFGIKDLSIPISYETFNTIQTLAPIAKNIEGKFSLDFKIGGVLGKNMIPLYDQLYGNGLIKITQAGLSSGKLISAISSVTKLGSGTDKVSLKDVTIKAEIKNGRLYMKPFDVNFGGYKTIISGSNGVDGSIDYTMKMNVPSGAIGDAVNNVIASVTGMNSVIGKNIKLNLKIGGTYNKPKVRLTGTEKGDDNTDDGLAVGVKNQIKQKIEEENAKAKAELDKKKKEAENKARKIKADIEAKAKAEVERLKKEAKDKVKNTFKNLFKKND